MVIGVLSITDYHVEQIYTLHGVQFVFEFEQFLDFYFYYNDIQNY